MYKFVAIFALLVAVSSAARIIRAAADEPVPIVRSESTNEADGSFKFSFESGDGTVREESGVVKNAGAEDAYVAITGSYKYIDADGQTVEVHYTADENGFVPTGTNIAEAIVNAAKAAATAGGS